MSKKSEPTTSNQLTYVSGASHAKTYRSPESEPGSTEPDRDCGANLPVSLASYDQDSLSWKTFQRCVFGGWIEYSETWPRSGMMLSGIAYQLKPSAPIIAGIGCSLLQQWPTPTVNGNYNKKGLSKTSGDGLATAVQKWPTPTARDYKDTGRPEMLAKYAHKKRLACSVAASDTSKPGSLNPDWVEWLMGFPIGWTDLGALETP